MSLAERRAEVEWKGNLERGNGSFAIGTWAVGEIPVSWAQRTGDDRGNTSPEELMAAAHASCYAMALNKVLDDADTPPEMLYVSAVCTLDEVDGRAKISSVDLEVWGRVPSLDAEGFRVATEEAERICPVSDALRGNVEVRLGAVLDEA